MAVKVSDAARRRMVEGFMRPRVYPPRTCQAHLHREAGSRSNFVDQGVATNRQVYALLVMPAICVVALTRSVSPLAGICWLMV